MNAPGVPAIAMGDAGCILDTNAPRCILDTNDHGCIHVMNALGSK